MSANGSAQRRANGVATPAAEAPSRLTFTNPATGEVFGERPMSSEADVRAARAALGEAAGVWARMPLKERIHILKQFQQVLIDNADEIAATVSRETGKPPQDGLIELFVSVNLLHDYCKHAPKWLGRERVSPGIYFFRRYYAEQRPFGTVAILGPWNYPLVMVLTPLCNALLAGNTALVKPSEVTAATGVLIESLVGRVPALAPFVRFVHGDGRVGQAVVAAQPDLIYLTGSSETGRKVAQAAAETLTPLVAELGGKDPMIVLEDADLRAAARWGAWGAFYNAGQTCMAVERLYVVEDIYDDFLDALVDETEKLNQGYTAATDSPYDLGPMTHEGQAEIADRHLQDAMGKGARLRTGGKRKGLFMEPTVLTDVDHTMLVMREETFGPLLPVMKVKDAAEAVRLANDSEFGLSASVWSQDIPRAERIASRLEAGGVLVNDALSHFAVTQLPFGGVKQSGNGRAHGREDLRQFTQTHAYSVGRPPLPFDIATILRYPRHYRLAKGLLHVLFGVTPGQRLAPLSEAFHEVATPDTSRRALDKVVALAGAAAAATAVVLGLLRWRR